MASYKKMKPVYEKNSTVRHPDFEVKETRVSDYLRKYGTGNIEDLPTSSAPEIKDDRSVDEMLDSEFEPSMATETVDILMLIDENKERFEKAISEMELTQKQKKDFDAAVAVLDDTNSSTDRKREAYAILEELENTGKLTRARKT